MATVSFARNGKHVYLRVGFRVFPRVIVSPVICSSRLQPELCRCMEYRYYYLDPGTLRNSLHHPERRIFEAESLVQSYPRLGL